MRTRPENSRILVLHGYVPPDALEDEKDVLVETHHVSNSLKQLGYKVKTAPTTLDLLHTKKILEKERPDLVFNLVESLDNSGRFLSVVPSLLEYLYVPFTGSGADALHITTHKPLSKSLMKLHGLPTPDWQTCDNVIQKGILFNPPYILKSIWEHASIGLNEKSIHFSKTTLLKTIHAMRPEIRANFFFEQFIEGREFNLSLLSEERRLNVLPPAEILFDGFGKKPKIVDYKAKWDVKSYQYHHTNRSFDFNKGDGVLLKKLKVLSLKCADSFAIKGYARIDFRVHSDGRPYILEVNANPCISPDSGFVAACEKAGLNYTDIIEKILAAA